MSDEMMLDRVRKRAEERLAGIKTATDSGLYARHYSEDVTALLAEQDAQRKNIADLHKDANRLIDDQRDLKQLVKKALNAQSPDDGRTWVLEAQAMLERMK